MSKTIKEFKKANPAYVEKIEKAPQPKWYEAAKDGFTVRRGDKVFPAAPKAAAKHIKKSNKEDVTVVMGIGQGHVFKLDMQEKRKRSPCDCRGA